MIQQKITKEGDTKKSESLSGSAGLAPHKKKRKTYKPSTASGEFTTLINRNYVFQLAGDSYCDALGKKAQDVVGSSVAAIWGEEIFNKVLKKCLDRCFTGEEVQFEDWIEFPDKGRRYFHLSHIPYLNEEGRVTHAAVASRDMTENRKETEAIKKSPSHFRASLQNMHFGVYSFDMEGCFTFVNDVVVERTGYSREWFMGRSLFEFVRPEEREEVRGHFHAAIRGEYVPPYEFGYCRPSADTSWAQVSTAPIFEKGRIVGVLGVLLDITKRKKFEEALKESEEKYRMLFEDSRDAIYITDRTGRLTDANRSFLKLFGYEPEEAQGLDVIDTYVDPADRELCVKVMKEQGFVKDFVLKLKKKDGTEIDGLLTGTARYAKDGAILSYQGIVRDITMQTRMERELMDSEQKLASIVCGLPVPQFIIDKDHVVTHWNRALELVTGIKAAEVVGTKQHWRAFYSHERPCIADLLVDESFSDIPNWYRGENGMSDVVKDGYKAMDFFREMGDEGKWLCFTASVIRDSRGAIIGAMETLEDLTEHKLAEETIQKAEEKCRSILETVSPHHL